MVRHFREGSHNRNNEAMQIKLDELIRAAKRRGRASQGKTMKEIADELRLSPKRSKCIAQTFGRNCTLPTPLSQSLIQRAGAKARARRNVGFALLGPAFASQLFQQLNLDLLDFEQPIVLAAKQVIDFFVQVPDFEFRL